MGSWLRGLSVVVCALIGSSAAVAGSDPCFELRQAVFEAQGRLDALRLALFDLESEIRLLSTEVDEAERALAAARATLATARLDLDEARVLGKATRTAAARVTEAHALVTRIAGDLAHLHRLLLDAFDRRAALRESNRRAEADLAACRGAFEACRPPVEALVVEPVEGISPIAPPGQRSIPAGGPVVVECGPESARALRVAFDEVCAQDLEARLPGALSNFSLNLYARICAGEIPVTLACVACDDRSPSPCAWGQPDLPLKLSTPTSSAIAEALRAAGGIRVHVCLSNDGRLPPHATRGALAECGSLRAIVAHELFHFLLNAFDHASSAWGDLADGLFRGEHPAD